MLAKLGKHGDVAEGFMGCLRESKHWDEAGALGVGRPRESSFLSSLLVFGLLLFLIFQIFSLGSKELCLRHLSLKAEGKPLAFHSLADHLYEALLQNSEVIFQGEVSELHTKY